MAPILKYVLCFALFLCVFFSSWTLVSSDEPESKTESPNTLKEEDSKPKEDVKPSKVKKLQIGVKKRVECDSKSKKGDILFMHYKGTLEDGKEFDNSYNRGEPLSFTLGSGQVIKGWDQGLLKMCPGEKRKLVIPPYLGYGASGVPPSIPGDATLIFEVELIKIEARSEL